MYVHTNGSLVTKSCSSLEGCRLSYTFVCPRSYVGGSNSQLGVTTPTPVSTCSPSPSQLQTSNNAMHSAEGIASLVYHDSTDPLFPFLDLASRRALRLACKSLCVAADARVRWLQHNPTPDLPDASRPMHGSHTTPAGEVVPLAMPTCPGAMQPHSHLSCWLQLPAAAAK